MRVEINNDDDIWTVVLDDSEQRFTLICRNKAAAYALQAVLAGVIEVHTIEEVEE